MWILNGILIFWFLDLLISQFMTKDGSGHGHSHGHSHSHGKSENEEILN
jgi:hypothetical protein